ncbi:hypothetical protein DEU56DRAFT_756348 [Suillus clintonianus]|uniref:uncharacterized protein n=1 Tax=Suillus clintonianus TaxID=1904413 RepID=UPI001B86BFB4|nr:uncharacterized protein DEU56DRAFT_756348 [Suillus clintonianus]KAG2136443.1 hypothetical protein DEU56DRAFT_756348 [Suillus clintonianus]
MSKKIQTAVICALLAGKKFIFQDEDTIREIYGLGPEMFNVENPHLSPNELASIQAMMSAVEKARTLKERYDILEGQRETSYGAGREALRIWCKRQDVHHAIGVRIDAAWHKLELTPLQLINESPTAGFPDVRDADPAKEDIALAIFGDYALSTTLRGDFRDTLTPIIHHNWERHRKVFRRVEASFTARKRTAREACEAIEHAEKVTPQMLREATAAVKKLSDSLQWFPHEVQGIQGIAELEEFLKHVVVTAVAKAKGISKEKLAPDIADNKDTPGAKRGRARASKIKNVSLSAAGDVDLIWPVYVQLFRTIQTEPEPPAVDFGGAEDDSVWGHSNDLGVETYRNHTDAALNALLHFTGGRPPLFAPLRSIRRKCAWDAEAEEEFVKENEDMVPLSLLWHQRVGIASIVEKMWLEHDDPEGVPGMLVADDVGIGKTAMVMGTIAFLIDTYWRAHMTLQKAKGILRYLNPLQICQAPILNNRPYFAGMKSIPNLPHLIIVPNSLLGQWRSELRIFFAPRTIEIYEYPTAEKEFAGFWTGPWAKSAMPLINRIILVTHSLREGIYGVLTVVAYGKVFDLRKGKAGHNLKKASDDKRHVKNSQLEHTCLWHKRNFALSALDEGHDYRNQTAGWYAILEVMKVSGLRMVLTATPLFTSPKDLCNIGRLLRIPYFTGKGGDEQETIHWKKLLAARRLITKDDQELAASQTIQRLTGSKSTHDEPASKIRVRQLTASWITQIKRGFAGRVIRRTVESRRFDGKKINDSLPPYKMIIVPVHMNESELSVIEKGMKSLAGDAKLGNLDDSNAFNSKFYLESRTKVAFPWHDSPVYPAIRTLQEYHDKRSTKVDILMTILRWHLISDENGVYRDLDKELTEVDQEALDNAYDKETDPDVIGPHSIDKELPGLMTMGKRKILVFTEFPMMAPLLISILRKHNIFALALNGTNTADERNDIIHKFNTMPQYRVLLFSTVGAVGLNLTVATIVILFDQCWSRMLVNQIIGRAWRLGQEDIVLVYNMVAVGTVDVLMVDHGEGKGKMLGQFLDKNKAVVNTIQCAMRGEKIRDDHHDDDDIEDDDPIETTDGPPRTSGASKSATTSASGSSSKSASASSAAQSNRADHYDDPIETTDGPPRTSGAFKPATTSAAGSSSKSASASSAETINRADEDDDEIEISDSPPRTSRAPKSATTSAAGSSRMSASVSSAAKINSAVEDDDEIEISDGPPRTLRKSVSAASRPYASSASDKNRPDRTMLRTYGGKKQVRNIQLTGDDDGKIFDSSTVHIDDDFVDEEEDATTSKGKQTLTGKGKGRQQVIVMMPLPMEKKKQRTRPKPGPKSKANIGSLASDPIELDADSPPDDGKGTSTTGAEKDLELTITGSSRESSMHADDNDNQAKHNVAPAGSQREPSVPDADDNDRSGGMQDPSSPTHPAWSMRDQRAVDTDDDNAYWSMDMDDSNLQDLDLQPVNDAFELDGNTLDGLAHGTQESTQDSMDVERMLGDRGMAQLRLTPGEDYVDVDNIVDPFPWQGWVRDEYPGRGKRRRNTGSSSSMASPTSGPLRSPPRVRPPRKKILLVGDGSARDHESAAHADSVGVGASLTVKCRTAVPANAPRPGASRTARARGGLLSRCLYFILGLIPCVIQDQARGDGARDGSASIHDGNDPNLEPSHRRVIERYCRETQYSMEAVNKRGGCTSYARIIGMVPIESRQRGRQTRSPLGAVSQVGCLQIVHGSSGPHWTASVMTTNQSSTQHLSITHLFDGSQWGPHLSSTPPITHRPHVCKTAPIGIGAVHILDLAQYLERGT